ncbi:MAG: hypothetical protein ACSLFK_10555 [Gemmatimonadaceae bacterium]
MTLKTLKLAGRKWKRQFNEAVARSIEKTFTEPVTNAYDSYRRINAGKEGSTGLVAALLEVPIGSHVIHEDLVRKLPRRPPRRIRVVINRSKRSALRERECRVIDQAEGMSAPELDEKLEEYGREKSGAGAGAPVRGLFGQGICDVVYTHGPATIRSIKDGEAAECSFVWDPKSQPQYEVKVLGRATQKHRKDWEIPSGNGTSVVFHLDERCRIPQDLEARIANFYMLRLIHADPSCSVTLEQVRHNGTSATDLRYNFPRGQVIKHIKVPIEHDGWTFHAEGVVVRADTSLPGRDDGEARANGLLLVDEVDTVYDQTLFSRYDTSVHLDQVYGVIRLTGIRAYIRERLDAGEALVTESRDGFDVTKSFYKSLESALMKELEPVFKKEIERRAGPSHELSAATSKKIEKVFQKLNEFFEDLTKQSPPGGGGGGTSIEVPDLMEFEDKVIELRLGQPRRIRLLANALELKPDTTVLVDTGSESVRITPTENTWTVLAGRPQILTANFVVSSDALNASTTVSAVAEHRDGKSVTATAEIATTLPPSLIEPPQNGLDFAPGTASAAPSRVGAIALLIDPDCIPLETDMLLTVNGSGIRLVADNGTRDVESLEVTFRKTDLLPDARVGRIALGFRGYGFGQRATIRATCFVGKKKKYEAEASLIIRDVKSPAGGVFKKITYGDLPESMERSASEFEPTTGEITVNRLHPINRATFGLTRENFNAAIESNVQAQSRLAEVVLDQCLYHALAVAHQNGQIRLPPEDVISGVRRAVEKFKFEKAPDVFREFVDGFKIPKVPKSDEPLIAA